LPGEFRRHRAETCHISAGVRETRHEPGPEWIGARGHHDRNRASLLSGRRNRNIRGSHDDVYLEAYQLAREVTKSFGPALAIARLQDERFPLDMAKVPHPLPERLNMRRGSLGARRKEPDLRNLGRLLRLGGERRGEEHRPCACEERATIHY